MPQCACVVIRKEPFACTQHPQHIAHAFVSSLCCGCRVGGLGSSAAVAALFMFYSACAGLDGVISAAQYTFFFFFFFCTTHSCTKGRRAQLCPRRPCAALRWWPWTELQRRAAGAEAAARVARQPCRRLADAGWSVWGRGREGGGVGQCVVLHRWNMTLRSHMTRRPIGASFGSGAVRFLQRDGRHWSSDGFIWEPAVSQYLERRPVRQGLNPVTE